MSGVWPGSWIWARVVPDVREANVIVAQESCCAVCGEAVQSLGGWSGSGPRLCGHCYEVRLRRLHPGAVCMCGWILGGRDRCLACGEVQVQVEGVCDGC